MLVTCQARITVGEVVADVTIEDVGAGPLEMRAAVDAAYHQKYGRYGAAAVEQMVGEEAAAATLILTPDAESS